MQHRSLGLLGLICHGKLRKVKDLKKRKRSKENLRPGSDLGKPHLLVKENENLSPKSGERKKLAPLCFKCLSSPLFLFQFLTLVSFPLQALSSISLLICKSKPAGVFRQTIVHRLSEGEEAQLPNSFKQNKNIFALLVCFKDIS